MVLPLKRSHIEKTSNGYELKFVKTKTDSSSTHHDDKLYSFFLERHNDLRVDFCQIVDSYLSIHDSLRWDKVEADRPIFLQGTETPRKVLCKSKKTENLLLTAILKAAGLWNPEWTRTLSDHSGRRTSIQWDLTMKIESIVIVWHARWTPEGNNGMITTYGSPEISNRLKIVPSMIQKQMLTFLKSNFDFSVVLSAGTLVKNDVSQKTRTPAAPPAQKIIPAAPPTQKMNIAAPPDQKMIPPAPPAQKMEIAAQKIKPSKVVAQPPALLVNINPSKKKKKKKKKLILEEDDDDDEKNKKRKKKKRKKKKKNKKAIQKMFKLFAEILEDIDSESD